MNPYTVLGLSSSASLSEAKAAYRKLAMKHHPDHGGNEETFKRIQAAWDHLESGKPVPQEGPVRPDKAPYKSSFTEAPGTTRQPPRPKPAPGYEARGPVPLPRTQIPPKQKYGSLDGVVDLQVTTQQTFEGCIVPFIHRGVRLEFQCRPGTMMYDSVDSFLMDEMIGAQRGTVNIHVRLRVSDPKPKPSGPPPEQTADNNIVFKICAIGLFTGGKIDARDHRGEVVPITIQPGFDPSAKITVPNKGYGPEGKRGNLRVTIEPVFKAPQHLNSNERKMLDRLNEMIK